VGSCAAEEIAVSRKTIAKKHDQGIIGWRKCGIKKAAGNDGRVIGQTQYRIGQGSYEGEGGGATKGGNKTVRAGKARRGQMGGGRGEGRCKKHLGGKQMEEIGETAGRL